ncbi:hypothetical protein COTS27_00100 [Spirochaetota bacterium]|nr:hypothetical protein COTS27_00100 [Spirochaetota bacterium]
MKGYRYYFDKSLNIKEFYQVVVSGTGEDEEVIAKLSVNFVSKGNAVLGRDKNASDIKTSSNIFYDSFSQSYIARESGYVHCDENQIFLYPFVYIDDRKIMASAIVPIHQYVLKKIDVHVLEKELQQSRLQFNDLKEIMEDIISLYETKGGKCLLSEGVAPRVPIGGVVNLAASQTEGFDISYKLRDNFLSYEKIKFAVKVIKDEAIGAYMPPVAGKTGIDVYGKVLKCNSMLTPIETRGYGKGIRIDPQTKIAYADLSGTMKFDFDNILIVAKTRTIYHDVNEYILSDEDLIVEGSALARAYIVCSGNVTIRGSIEGGRVIATGSIVVEGSIINRAYVKADKNIEFQFASKATLIAKGSIKARKYILDVKVHAMGYLKIYDTERGSIVGGEIHIGGNVSVAMGGSTSGKATQIEILRFPHRHLINVNLQDIKYQRELINAELKKLASIYGVRYIEEGVPLDPQDSRYDKIQRAKMQAADLNTQLKTLKEQENQLNQELDLAATTPLKNTYANTYTNIYTNTQANLATSTQTTPPGGADKSDTTANIHAVTFTKAAFPNLKITIRNKGTQLTEKYTGIQFYLDAKSGSIAKRLL